MEMFVAKGASVISEPKPAPLFDGRLVAFLETPLGIFELLEATRSLGYAASARRAERVIAVTATFTAEPLKDALEFWLRELELPFRVEFAPYHQVFQQLLDPSSLLSKNETGVDLILVRFEDWSQSADQAEIERNARDFIRALTAAGQSRTRLLGLCPTAPDNRRWEDLLASELAGVDGLTVIGSSEVTARYPVSRIQDPHAQEIGRIPYTPEFFTALCTTLARTLHALERDPYKVIVLDCDGTLWQGVCAEVGPLGVRIDAPYQALQDVLVARQQAGLLLCLCSKNQEADVFAVFEQRQGERI